MMRSYINRNGYLVIVAGEETESYALWGWCKDNKEQIPWDEIKIKILDESGSELISTLKTIYHRDL